MSQDRPAIPLPLRILHWILLANFAINIFYCSYQIFVVLAPDGHIGPLWGAASELSTELVVKRRLYAIEFWVTVGSGSIYLALTEILPRSLKGLLTELMAKRGPA